MLPAWSIQHKEMNVFSLPMREDWDDYMNIEDDEDSSNYCGLCSSSDGGDDNDESGEQYYTI